MILLDVGVWLAAVWGRHVHHPTVSRWFHEQSRELVLCRVTQMSVLRLLTNPAVMGVDVTTRRAAWDVLDRLRADDRVRWVGEPTHLEPVWRVMSARDDRSHKLWTDDYLAAFARAGGMAIATLDEQFASRYPSVRVETPA